MRLLIHDVRALHVYFSFRTFEKRLTKQHIAGRTNPSRRIHSTCFQPWPTTSAAGSHFSSSLGYHNLRMNGLPNSSPHDPRKRSPFTWVAAQPTHPPTRSFFCPANYLLLHFEMLYIGSGFFTSFVSTWDQDGMGMGMEMVEGYIFIQRQLELRAYLFSSFC